MLAEAHTSREASKDRCWLAVRIGAKRFALDGLPLDVIWLAVATLFADKRCFPVSVAFTVAPSMSSTS
jgi:hypothetical protein